MSGMHARPGRAIRAYAALSAAWGWLRLTVRLPRGRDGEPSCGDCGCRLDALCEHECCKVGRLSAADVAELTGQWDISDAEHQAARADLIARHGELPPSLRMVEERGGRFGLPIPRELLELPPDAIRMSIPPMRVRLDGLPLESELDRAAEQAGLPLEPLPAPTVIWHADRDISASDLPNAAAGNWQPRPATFTIWTQGSTPGSPWASASETEAAWLPATPQNPGMPDIDNLDDTGVIPALLAWALNAPLAEVQAAHG